MIEGAVVIDMSGLKNFRIDPVNETMWVQPGVTTGDFIGAATELGFALPTGDARTVGLGGLTLGGGIGFLVRKHGMTIDHLLAAEVVTADGEIVRASETENSDLFWAIRGGGGNFGIITAFEFRLERVAMVYGGLLVLPATPEVIRGYVDYSKSAPEELTSITMMMGAPPAPFIPEDKVGTTAMMIAAVYAGDLEDGERAIAPLRALAEPIADLVGPMPYAGIYQFMEAAEQPHGIAIRSAFVDEVSDEFIEKAIAAFESAPSPLVAVQWRPLGGQMARVSSDATAFAHRNAGYMIAALGLWEPGGDADAHWAWTERVWDALRPIARGVYSNFLANEGEARIREAYPPATYARLAEVKRKYDPDNVFHFNQNIKPS
jgi:FAD/FMN-containing dehydrogenase